MVAQFVFALTHKLSVMTKAAHVQQQRRRLLQLQQHPLWMDLEVISDIQATEENLVRGDNLLVSILAQIWKVTKELINF